MCCIVVWCVGDVVVWMGVGFILIECFDWCFVVIMF